MTPTTTAPRNLKDEESRSPGPPTARLDSQAPSGPLDRMWSKHKMDSALINLTAVPSG